MQESCAHSEKRCAGLEVPIMDRWGERLAVAAIFVVFILAGVLVWPRCSFAAFCKLAGAI
jgi:hypothetical protein